MEENKIKYFLQIFDSLIYNDFMQYDGNGAYIVFFESFNTKISSKICKQRLKLAYFRYYDKFWLFGFFSNLVLNLYTFINLNLFGFFFCVLLIVMSQLNRMLKQNKKLY
jgi:hypothetical protein